MNKQNVRVWGTEPPRAVVEHVRNSPKLNMFCVISHTKMYGPLLFAEQTVTGPRYLDMLQIWLMPQLNEEQDNFIFQQDGAPPH